MTTHRTAGKLNKNTAAALALAQLGAAPDFHAPRPERRRYALSARQRSWCASAAKRIMRRARRKGVDMGWSQARARAIDDCLTLGISR